jgi:hypothetical protein
VVLVPVRSVTSHQPHILWHLKVGLVESWRKRRPRGDTNGYMGGVVSSNESCSRQWPHGGSDNGSGIGSSIVVMLVAVPSVIATVVVVVAITMYGRDVGDGVTDYYYALHYCCISYISYSNCYNL